MQLEFHYMKRVATGSATVLDLMNRSSISSSNNTLLPTSPIFAILQRDHSSHRYEGGSIPGTANEELFRSEILSVINQYHSYASNATTVATNTADTSSHLDANDCAHPFDDLYAGIDEFDESIKEVFSMLPSDNIFRSTVGDALWTQSSQSYPELLLKP
ncbi:hypothetical protein BGZ98_000195 [Dissophora globulifera]|nr:hypothetical protein BGZ98_000195 [Dissophora globulifera]